MNDQAAVPAPKGLGMRGRRLWKSVVSTYALRPDEQIVLENACRALDLCSAIDAEMRTQPLVVKGSLGQMRENPLLSEQRQQRAMVNASLKQLGLPDAEGAATSRSTQARAAAQSRWAAAHGER